MTEQIKAFKEALESGRDMDFMKNSGYLFSKDELVSICAELFYTAYQELTDGGCLPEEAQYQNYRGFIRRFMDNMNEYENGYFDDRGGVLEVHDVNTGTTYYRALWDVKTPVCDQDEATSWGLPIEDYIRAITKNGGEQHVIRYMGQDNRPITDTLFFYKSDAEDALEELREWSRT